MAPAIKPGMTLGLPLMVVGCEEVGGAVSPKVDVVTSCAAIEMLRRCGAITAGEEKLLVRIMRRLATALGEKPIRRAA